VPRVASRRAQYALTFIGGRPSMPDMTRTTSPLRSRALLSLVAALALVTACGAAPAPPSLAGAAPACEATGAILYREVHRPLDATTGQLGAATSLTIWASGAWRTDLDAAGAGCLDEATLTRLLDQLGAPAFAPAGEPTCAGLPTEQVSVEVADAGAIEYQQPCGRGPDAATERAIAAAHAAVRGAQTEAGRGTVLADESPAVRS
jgi:hypothetical protein